MPPAFVLSQDQTLHKIILTTSVVMIFLKNRLSSISLCNLNYIQINVNCQVTSHYSIFKQLSAIKLIVYQPRRFAYRIAAWYLIYHKFEICQILFSTFFKLFYFNPADRFIVNQIAAWDLIYHSLKFCQILFQTFFDFFVNHPQMHLVSIWWRAF